MKKKLGLSLLLMAVAIPVAVAGGGGPGKGEKKDDGPLQGKQVQAPLMAAPVAAAAPRDIFEAPDTQISLIEFIPSDDGLKAILQATLTGFDPMEKIVAIPSKVTRIVHNDAELYSQKIVDATFIFGGKARKLSGPLEGPIPYIESKPREEVQAPDTDGWSTVLEYESYIRSLDGTTFERLIGPLFQQRVEVHVEKVGEKTKCIQEGMKTFKQYHRNQYFDLVDSWQVTFRRNMDGSGVKVTESPKKREEKYTATRDESQCGGNK